MTRSSTLSKTTILQSTVQGRRRGRQRKKWADNITDWTGKTFAETQALTRPQKMERVGTPFINSVPAYDLGGQGTDDDDNEPATGVLRLCAKFDVNIFSHYLDILVT